MTVPMGKIRVAIHHDVLKLAYELFYKIGL